MIVDSGNTKSLNFYVAWDTDKNAVFYNVFDADYSLPGSETEVNAGDPDSDNPRLAVSDNQVCLVFQAKKFNNGALSANGVLFYIADRTDI